MREEAVDDHRLLHVELQVSYLLEVIDVKEDRRAEKKSLQLPLDCGIGVLRTGA